MPYNKTDLTIELISQILSLKAEGKNRSEIARIIGRNESTLRYWDKKEWLDESRIPKEDEIKVDDRYVHELSKFISNAGVEKLITTFKYPIVTSKIIPSGRNHFVIPDTQAKEGIDLSYLRWIGHYIVDRKPEAIIHLGDHGDMPSLSTYDRGTRGAEGKRVTIDLNAAIRGMEELLKPLWDYQQKELEIYGEIRYKPYMLLCLGNHEFRLQRHIDTNPELHGLLSYDSFLYGDSGWIVADYQEPRIVNGVTYCHFMANPMTGKPYGGTALNILKNVGESFTQGHKQCLDVATRNLPSSGRQQWAIIAGAAYPHAEGYKGYGGNHHWRGIIVKHGVKDGSYNPMFIDLDYLKKRFD